MNGYTYLMQNLLMTEPLSGRNLIARTLFLFAVAMVVILGPSNPGFAAEPLKEYTNCQLIDEPWADGDSFHVRFPEDIDGGRDHVVRLYYVDCPESVARLDSDVDRLREQTRYFGVKDPMQTLSIGKKAKEFVKSALSEPFTVWTRLANARGRATKPRIYGIVILANEKPLDELLVRNGLARNKGVRTGLPDGTTIEQHRERLDGLQTEAIMRSVGIWQHSDPMAIVPGREATLKEERERQKIIRAARANQSTKSFRVDPNKASPEELQDLPGIGPELADRLIENRPYQTTEDLRRVPGIGPATVEKLRPYLVFGDVK